MPAKITFTKKEEEWLKALFDAGHTEVSSLLSKMEKARNKPETFKGVSVQAVIDFAVVTLGDRLTLPPNRTSGWYAKMQRALNDGGITEEIAVKAIKFVEKNWGDKIWIETLIYSMAKIAAGAMPDSGKNDKKRPGFKPSSKSGWLSQLDNKEEE